MHSWPDFKLAWSRSADEWRWLRHDIGWTRRKALRWVIVAIRRP